MDHDFMYFYFLACQILSQSDDRRRSYDIISIFQDGGHSPKDTSAFSASDCIRLRRWKSVCVPNFDEISQSTAEIKLLPVSEKTAAILEFHFRFRSWPMFSPPHVILLQPVKFCSNPTTGVGVMTSYRFFKTAAIESESYFRSSEFSFSDCIRLRTWKSTCVQNFDKISQSTAEIKQLPVSENGRPPYWNFTSNFDSDLCVVIGMWYCFSLPNLVVIRRSTGDMTTYRFCKMAVIDSEIYFRVQV